ncbi:MAG: hypothetical protein HIU81_03645 [Acidobacteria bacterium]|nr:hypothetical protein [Acidobacteriota bacterium]
MSDACFDFVTATTAVVFQDKPVVYRSTWLMQAAATAQDMGKDFVVLTPPSATLTLPMSDLIASDGFQWLATMDGGSFFDGITGRVHRWDGLDFAATDTIADDYLQMDNNSGGLVHVRANTMHPASAASRVGELVQSIFVELTDEPPVGWGMNEPASEPWDVAELTEHCLNIAPNTSSIVVVGAARPGTKVPSVAVLTVERSSSGVRETVEFLAESADPLSRPQLDSFAEVMHRARVRTALLGHAVAFKGLCRPARFTGMSVPGCAVFGAEALAGHGSSTALANAGATARLLGTAPYESLAVTYPQEPLAGQKHPLELYAELVAWLEGQDNTAR